MASKAQAPSQGRAASKESAGKVAGARYLSSTSASSSRATASATPSTSASSSRAKQTDPRPVKPNARTVAQGASLRPSKSASHVAGSTSGRVPALKPSESVTKHLTPSASSPALSKKAKSKEQRPTPAETVTRERPNPLTIPDTLQQAAQTQSWLYMLASLESSFAAAERSAAAALEQRRAELSAQEVDIADARVRFDAERLVNFYEELLAPQVAGAIASLVQGFLNHEDACTRTLAEVLLLVKRPANEKLRITQFNKVLDELDQLLEEAAQLESSITAIAPEQAGSIAEANDRPEQGSRLIPTLLALLPVLRMRVTNLECARTIIQSGKTNLRLAIKS